MDSTSGLLKMKVLRALARAKRCDYSYLRYNVKLEISFILYLKIFISMYKLKIHPEDFQVTEICDLEITGGSDNDGFPMRKDVEGSARKKIILTGAPGFHPKTDGLRKRKSVRGWSVI